MSSYSARGQILVIEPAVRYPNLDCLNQLALLTRLPIAYHLPGLFGLDSLEQTDPDQVCGVIVLGSVASVNDNLPWQQPLAGWLTEFWARRLPTLGICFGHQLIARLFGARVGLAFDGNERCTFRRVRLHDAPSWSGAAAEVELPVSHREAVLDAPAPLRAFGSSDEVGIEAIAHRELPIFGFQAHLEATPLWLARHGISVPDPKAHLKDARGLLAAFLALVEQTVREKSL